MNDLGLEFPEETIERLITPEIEWDYQIDFLWLFFYEILDVFP